MKQGMKTREQQLEERRKHFMRQAARGGQPLPQAPAEPTRPTLTPIAVGPMETQPGVMRPIPLAQIQPHQVVRRGEFDPAVQSPMGAGAYAPRSGQETVVTTRPAQPAPLPQPASAQVQEAIQADVTVILYSSGESPNLLASQVEALRRQSVHAAQVWVHVDGLTGHDERTLARMTCHRTSVHFGRHFRVALARNVTTRYVAILDEDALPGRRFLERCVGALMEVEAESGPAGAAVIAGAGSVLTGDDPAAVRVVGPEMPRDEPAVVDFGRQSWVFDARVAHAADTAASVGNSAIAFGIRMAVGARIAGIPTVVLDYGVDRDAWPILAESRVVSASQDVYLAYEAQRSMGWMPGGLDAGEAPSASEHDEGAAPAPAETAERSPVVRRQGSGESAVTTVERVLLPHERTPAPEYAKTERIVPSTDPPAYQKTEQVIVASPAPAYQATERIIGASPAKTTSGG